MRISDWSSDVCSSDLPDEVLDAERFGVGLHPVGDFPAQVEGRPLGGHAAGVAAGAVAGAAQGVLGGLARARGATRRGSGGELLPDLGQIGRQSRWARESTSGSISVVAE